MSAKTIGSKKDLDGELGSGGGRFALFYSAYCPFCVMFMPAFDKLAAEKPGALLKIDTDRLPELEDAFSVEVVPTVLFFSGGRLEKRLDGALGRGLTEAGLLNFVKACAGKEKTE